MNYRTKQFSNPFNRLDLLSPVFPEVKNLIKVASIRLSKGEECQESELRDIITIKRKDSFYLKELNFMTS